MAIAYPMRRVGHVGVLFGCPPTHFAATGISTPRPKIEVLAPAGGPAALTAALDAGADAVYFGLRQLNARRGAENFAPAHLRETVARIHARGARAYLTLNIDVSHRELGQAVRHLELARQSRIDAVLVRDAGLLALIPLYPEMEFHFSTQAGISSSAGMHAARTLGLRRVVLARELAQAEVAAAAAVPGIETEVFTQGALCFCVSGRCLLSSWVGGRSGNRGTCTSPCRVVWQAGAEQGRLLSMRDLCLMERVAQLQAVGVHAFKIEGRLKKPDWVARAVSLYRTALSGTPIGTTEREAATWLGAYTGRQLTAGFWDGERGAMTGEAGRLASEGKTGSGTDPGMDETVAATGGAGPAADLDIAVTRDERGGLRWQFRRGDHHWGKRTPFQPVRRLDRSVTLTDVTDRLCREMQPPLQAGERTLFDPEFRIPRNSAKAVIDMCQTELRRQGKPPDDTVRLALPPAVRVKLACGLPCPANRHCLGTVPDTVRIRAADAERCQRLPRALDRIVEQVTPGTVARLAAAAGGSVTIALPAVLYEADLASARALVAECGHADVTVEVNSWDGWYLAKDCGVRMTAGPGLMVLNALAAQQLASLGCGAVTVSLEADREQMEALCGCTPVPLCLYVFGRPALMQTRVELDSCRNAGEVLADGRGVRLRRWREGSVSALRPIDPFSLCGLHNEKIRAAHLVADLVGSPDIVADWHTILSHAPTRLRFNYDRTLR